jgi:hypothetical protein
MVILERTVGIDYLATFTSNRYQAITLKTHLGILGCPPSPSSGVQKSAREKGGKERFRV